MTDKTKISRKDIVVEVLRDGEGKLYSQVRPEPNPRYSPALVIDRQDNRGRAQYGENFVRHRAQHLAKIIEVEYIEDLRWPCKALEKTGECHCPECSIKRSEGIGVRHTRPIEP